MNCDDMLMLAVERKRMKKKAEQIERKKDTINRRNAIVEDALSIFAKGSNLLSDNYEKWLFTPVQGIQGLIGATYKFDW